MNRLNGVGRTLIHAGEMPDFHIRESRRNGECVAAGIESKDPAEIGRVCD